jgi:PAS domain S-box-containing protein
MRYNPSLDSMKATEKMDQSSVFGRMLEGFALYEVILNTAGDPSDYRFLYINPAFERISGFKSGDVVGKTIREVLPDAESFWFEIFGSVARTCEPLRLERFSPSLNKYFEVSAYAPIKGQCAAIFLDVTERKRMEEALRETRGFLGSLLEAMPMPIYVVDANTGFYRMVNRAWEEISGVSREQAIGRSPYFVVPHHVAEDCLKSLQHIKDSAQNIAEEMTTYFPQGRRIFHTVKFPLKDAKGRVDAVGTIAADITPRRHAEESLKENEAILRSFFDSPGQHRGIVELVEDDILHISVNEVAAAFLGRTKDSMCNIRMSALGFSREEISMWISRYEESKRTGQHVRFEFQYNRENKEGWFVGRVSYLGDYSGHSRYAYVITDISARKNAEADRERLLGELQRALSEVKTLSGLLPICSACKKIRDTAGSWSDVESYIQTRSDAYFSHGICPDCVKTLYPDMTELH